MQNSKLGELLRSRKFYAALIGMLFVFLGDRAGLGAEEVTNAVYLIVTFIVGTALESRIRA